MDGVRPSSNHWWAKELEVSERAVYRDAVPFLQTVQQAVWQNRILALGRAIEVLEPEALRCNVIDFARQTLGVYSGNLLKS